MNHARTTLWMAAWIFGGTALLVSACGNDGERRRPGGAGSLAITTATLPDGTVGQVYSLALAAKGGQTPYTWTVSAGSPPSGIALATDGTLSGVPTLAGTSTFTVRVTDAGVPARSATRALDLTVLPSSGNTPPVLGPCFILATQRGLVDICYDLIDIESDPVTLTVEHSTDGGATFSLATGGPGGAGLGPLASSPTGTRHLYVWDSGADLPAFVGTVDVRLTPADAQPGAPATVSVLLDNTPGQGRFVPSPDLAVARRNHTATWLVDNRVLVTGGEGIGGTVLDSAEIFDPLTGDFALLPAVMTSPRTWHTATRLPDDTVLIAGGSATNANGSELDTTEIFDPSTDTFIPGATMAQRRRGHATVTASVDRAFVTGGENWPTPNYFAESEQYDVPGMFFSLPDTIDQARSFHTATTLSNGHILLVGGSESGGLTVEEFDPSSGSSPYAQAFKAFLEIIHHRATELQGGDVLVTGGGPGRTVISLATSYDNAFLHTPGGSLSPAPSNLNTARHAHSADRLVDGRVLVAGGHESISFVPLDESELYDPVTGAFAVGEPMNAPRARHASVLLRDGRVLITGGTSTNADPISTTERYHP